MTFIEHVALLLAGLVGFAIWPNIRRGATGVTNAVDGIPCDYTQRRASRSNQVTVTVTMACDERFEFTLRREGAFDRFAKALHLAREFQTHDERFDEAIYIGADESGIDEWLAQDAESRKALLDLLALEPEERTHIRSITADRGVLTLTAVATPRMLASAPTDIALRVATVTVPALKQCVGQLQEFAAGNADPGAFRDAYAVSVRTLVSLTAGLLFVPLIVVLLSQIQQPTSVHLATNQFTDKYTLTVAAVVVGILLVTALLLLRGSARLHTVLAPLVLCGALAAFVASPPLISELNTEWDQSTPQRYPVQVMRLYLTHGKNSTYYHVWLSDWHSQADHRDLEVDEATYDGLHEGDAVTVSERQGYLRRPWVSDLSRY